MTTIKNFDAFNESKSPLDAEKVLLTSYIKKSEWLKTQTKAIREAILKLVNTEVKVVSKVEGSNLYAVATNDEAMPTVDIPAQFLLV
jgi:hypothetical protein